MWRGKNYEMIYIYVVICSVSFVFCYLKYFCDFVDLEDKVNVQNLIKFKVKFCRLCDFFVYDLGFRKRKCDILFLVKEDYFSIKVRNIFCF